MTAIDVKNIMESNEVWKYDYAVNEPNKPLAEVASVLECRPGHYRSRVMERNVIIEEHSYSDEDSACRGFLKEMAQDYPVLKKYL